MSNNTVIGKCLVECDGVELGLITTEGLGFLVDQKTVKLMANQSPGLLDAGSESQEITIKTQFLELHLENLSKFWNLVDAPSGGVLELKVQNKLPKRNFLLTMPGPDGKTRVVEVTGSFMSCGELKNSTTEYASAEIEIGCYINPATNSYGRITDADESSSAPSVANWYSRVSSSDTSMSDGATSIPVAASIVIDFDVSIRPDQLTDAKIFLQADGANTNISATLKYSESGGVKDLSKIVLDPVSSLSTSTTYNVVVNKGLLSIDGIPSASMVARQFTTAGS